jgi:signal transduction histidine kinase
MLSARTSHLRDWGLFALAALVPAATAGFLGFRALRNEEAALRREEVVALRAEVERASRIVREELEVAEGALPTLPAEDAKVEPWLRAHAPPFAEPLVLDADGHLRGETVTPGGGAAPDGGRATPPSECAAWALALARASSMPGPERAKFLERCEEYQSDTGRWVWPVLALPGLAAEDGERFAEWIEVHAPRMREGERAANARAVLATPELAAPLRARLLAALDPERSGGDTLRAALRAPGAADAIGAARRGPEATPVRWASGSSRGVVVRQASGAVVGFVVHRQSLQRSLPLGWAELGENRATRVVTSSTLDAAPSEDALRGFVTVAPELAVEVTLADPALLDVRASRSRTVLAVATGFAAVVAFALAAWLFARMRAARRSSELRVGFVSTVSHELRTPIASVRMLAELLEQGRVEADERDEVYQALALEARRLGETVDRLLGFSRMAAGRVTLDRRRVLVADVVDESLQAFQARHPESELDLDLDRELYATLDPDQLRLALDNLLANAHKYAPGGGPYRVRLARDDGAVTLSVSDAGPGIAARDHKRIFEPFERADDRLSRATEGSGIGLSLVAHVARAHGGRVTVDSAPGKGARFTITLPKEPR